MTFPDDLESKMREIPVLLKKREKDLERREEELRKAEKRFTEKYPNHGKESDVLHLNVGGTNICVLRRTLIQIDGSVLASMFSGRWDDNLEKDADGRIFIDQDIKLFEPLVNYLRALGSQTLATDAPEPPFFEDDWQRKNFCTMVDYYGMTLGVFRVGVYIHGKTNPIAYPGTEISATEKTSYWLDTLDQTRCVKSFEVTMGSFSTLQIGWLNLSRVGQLADTDQGGNEGVGYVGSSSCFDSSKSVMVVSGVCTGVSGISVKEGTVIRCEEGAWKFDGEVKVSTTNCPVPGTPQLNLSWDFPGLVPCLTVKGAFTVTNVELTH